MKTIEEKAKAYDEALEKAKMSYHTGDYDKDTLEMLEIIFPELAENKDEEVRKALLELVHDTTGDELWIDYNVHKEEALDWLERQGEHANFLSKIQVGDKVTRNEAGVLVNLSQLKRVAKPSKKQGEQEKDILEDAILDGNEDGLIAETIRYKNEKQGEKKPACEEDEPQKELAKSYLTKFDEKFPILPTLKGKQLADYKNFLNKCQQIFRLKYWGIRPIQAKLFEKLSLLWAAWGAEHLQGLGQTDGDMDNEISMWSEEDEDYLFLLNSICKDAEEKYRNSPDVLVRKEIANARNWLKSLRPQSRWKPSSEQIGLLQAIINEPKNAASESCQIVLREVLEQLKKLKEE